MSFQYALAVAAILFTCSAGNPAAAQWQPAGPSFEKIASFASDGEYDYAGSTHGSGVYRSADGGRSWTRFWTGLQSGSSIRPVTSLAAAGGVVLAGAGSVYRSTNQGETWALAQTGLPARNDVQQIVAVGDAFAVIAGETSTHRLHVSTDGGLNWTAIGPSSMRSDARTVLHAVGDTLWVIGLKAGSARHQLFRTTDLGATWTEATLPGSGGVASAAMAHSNGRLFVTGAGMYYSDDEGLTWTKTSGQAGGGQLAAIGEIVVSTTPRRVYVSTDHGVTSAPSTAGLPVVEAALHGPFENGEAFFVSQEQVYPFRSTDGVNWEPSGVGMRQEFLMNGIVHRGDTLLASYNLGLFWSNDGGRHWYLPEVPPGTGPIGGVIATDSTFLALGQLATLRSTDGHSWQKIATPPIWGIQRTFVTEDAIYAATQNAALIKSTDGGYTWATIAGTPNKLADVAVRGDVILLVDANPSTPVLLVSTDAGQTWQYPAGVLAATVAATETMYFSAINHVLAGSKLWSSSDGITWTELVPPGPISRLYAHGNTLFANVASNGVSWSTDNGVTWQGDATGFPPSNIVSYSASHMLVHRDTLYMSIGAGSGIGGIWKYGLPEGTVTGVEVEGGLPYSLVLQGAYPNPFNPSTRISYSLPEAAHVRLSVYDLLGREVAVLVDASQAAGDHAATFDAGGIPSAMYLYRLEAAGQVRLRSMVLVK